MICLDTNIVIWIVNGRSSSLRHRLGEQIRAGTPVALPIVALFEMRYGFAKSGRREHNERLLERFLGLGIDVLPFETDDGMHAGEIRAELESKGTPIGHYDYLIAAQARRRGAALVTLNTREFSRVPGLILVDWAS
ncbi:type II toxin-antitoxin system VapC family toxin [Bradyrhizobium sp. Arg237L]|uniref:type II toxin-antitoxin system VapC family toxin n=1 Tax=Bradyrhizobium sp. Arg237L TaxID=3003352 RepID=UPI00249EC21D|nr:type II toxin-antitoxin system VapC family toxin [Bradyrhizobium sp. Arg237L]MDI4233658.1 type II toxin-antitoxin system VapC family toxin [Bradyrhizobium sp. Arg237L]